MKESLIKSILIWTAIIFLILMWLPLLAVRRLFDRDKAHYKTGRLFRLLGKFITRVNPGWKIDISGNTEIDDRNPYIIVCNHLSNADIPVISNLPMEMKWVAKKELFDIPVVGWMMKLAGDISVDRRGANRKQETFLQARYYLENHCSVFFFPEGTRSRNGRVNAFTRGAFELAIKEQLPILPLAIDGTQNALPKRSWRFKKASNIRLKVLEPVRTNGLTKNDISELTHQVRDSILKQISEWRGQPVKEIDNIRREKKRSH